VSRRGCSRDRYDILVCGSSIRGGPGLPIALGTALAGSGLLALLWLRLDTPYSHIWWTFALFGAGLGLVTAPMAAAAVAGMPPSQSGVASAILNTSRQVGGAVGIALLGAVFSAASAPPCRRRSATPPAVPPAASRSLTPPSGA
jgi:peptidoglycan biosynthesis protein MviN/MurJ (putative lipid II flippase)